MFFHTANGIGFTYTDSAGRLPLILSMQVQHGDIFPSIKANKLTRLCRTQDCRF